MLKKCCILLKFAEICLAPNQLPKSSIFTTIPINFAEFHGYSCWNVLKYAEIWIYTDLCWNMLKHAEICWNMLKYAEICWNMRKYAEICWTLLNSNAQQCSAYSSIFQPMSAYFSIFQHISAYFSIFQHTSAYFRMFQNIIWVPTAKLVFNQASHRVGGAGYYLGADH